MLRSLSTAVSGMQNYQQQIDVIGDNIANVNTLGFHASRADFADSFSQTLQASSAGSAGTSGQSAMQVGSGVATAAIRSVDTQGALARTDLPTDLAIAGNGYFMVRDTVTNTQYATRAGDFRLDAQGYLVTNTGCRVQGYTDPDLKTLGDVQINATGKPASAKADADLLTFDIDLQGKVNVNLSDGTQFVRGQILLQNFSDPQALMREGNNLYSGIGAAGPLGGAGSPTPAAPGTNGLGQVQKGALELSNVDLATEFSELIAAQRAFQASARMITTSDELMQETVNLKR
jgi:flagellar hook protein FlgE